MNMKFGPKDKDHPSIGELCLICGRTFLEGDYTTLVETQPADEEEKIKMLKGLPYTSEAEEVHYSCYIEVKSKN